jgi:preprotein translocase subunit SecD
VAKNASRPGRRLIVFAILIAAMYGGIALEGVWTPKLGLDLQGGTRITLEASTSTGEEITPEKMEEARGIIDQRVNGQGVAEAEVAVQGNRNIVVEIPGERRTDLVDDVSQTAQLRFRLVALAAPGTPTPEPSEQPSGDPSASPSDDASGSPDAKPSESPAEDPSDEASPRGRALSGGLVAADKKAGDKNNKKNDGKKNDGKGNAGDEEQPAPSDEPAPQEGLPGTTSKGAPVDQPLKWQDDPGDEWIKKFGEFQCGDDKMPDVRDQPLIACDDEGNKYLLSASMIQGTQLTGAEAGIPQSQVQWVVSLTFDKTARETFANVTRQIVNATSPLTGQQKQFAIVLDGQVLSAPVVNGVIPNGRAEISGDFNQESAQSLANSLKYGALPLTFTAPVVTEEGPTLASDQLSAGLLAGGIGLALVLIYCMFYYRGLGIVVVASLGVAAVVTYGVILAMSQAVNFTLTLPGIAGLIVGVGITADSFIVYFERIRDEMREGKSMRVAVEVGWVRARATCLAADAVSLLAAVVLYIFAIGVVKGFAFALGITTLIDLAVFFMFTKPMVSWLSKFHFFNSGHPLSGLSPEAIGIDYIAGASRPATTGGAAR